SSRSRSTTGIPTSSSRTCGPCTRRPPRSAASSGSSHASASTTPSSRDGFAAGSDRSCSPPSSRRRPARRAIPAGTRRAGARPGPGRGRRPPDIVVPVLNEEAGIDEFHDRVARLGYADALLFVDNASTDGTVSRIERRGSRLIRHARNEGYGASIRDGIAASDGELVVIADADLEYPPEAIPVIVHA